MSKISKSKLDPTIEKHLSTQFWDTLNYLGSRQKTKQILTDLLTETEIAMLTKRLAVAILLHQGKSQNYISQSLKVSFTKTGSVANWLKNASPETLREIEKLSNRSSWKKFSQLIDQLISSLLTPTAPAPKSSGYIKSSMFVNK